GLAEAVLRIRVKHHEAVVERLEGRVLRREADRYSAADVARSVGDGPVDLVVLDERHADGIDGAGGDRIDPCIGAVSRGQTHGLLCVAFEETSAATDASGVRRLDDSTHGRN